MPKRTRSSVSNWLVGVLVVCGAVPALAQRVTGQWDFNDPNDGLKATVGSDGYVWVRTQNPDELPNGFPQDRSEFDLASTFNVPFPSGDGGVINFGAYNQLEGIDIYPNIPANGGGSFVNQYTMVFDVRYPASSLGGFIAFYQTNACNEDDSDLFINGAGGIGISGDYDGEIQGDTWHRVVASFDLANEQASDVVNKTGFGTTTSFGISDFSDGPGGVVSVADYNQLEALDAFHGMAANGGGSFVNNYTVVMDVYVNSIGSWQALLQTSECNTNDGDFWVTPDGFIGGSGPRDGGPLDAQTWYRIAVVVDGENGQLLKYIDGAQAGSAESISLDGRFSLYPAADSIPLMLFGDNNGETLDAYIGSVQIRDYAMTAGELGLLGGASASNIAGGTGVVGQWDFDGGDLSATTGTDLAYYDGARCGFTGLPAPLLRKYIDGVLVDTQILGSGVDGRWSLPPAGSPDPVILFTDNGGETAPGYAGSVQIRDYAMTDAEVAALGGVDAGNIPGGAGVAFQLDFDNPNTPLAATVGLDAEWFTDERCQVPFTGGDPDSVTNFDSSGALGVSLPDGDSGVMHITRGYAENEGIELYPGIGPNGGGAAVNAYTLIMDVYYPSINGFIGLYQVDDCNGNDAEIFIDGAGGIGISGQYDGVVTANTWHRIAIAVDMFPPNEEKIRKYIDGVKVGGQDVGSLDARWSLWPADNNRPVLLFTDDAGETAEVYVSSVQIRSKALSDAEVAALGGASAANIPTTGGSVAGQWDFENAADGLAATTGNDLLWFTGDRCQDCGQDLLADTEFGPAFDYFAPDMADGPANVMYADAAEPCTAYLMPHGATPNGGGNNVNKYTMIMDIYVPIFDYFGPPLGHVPSWIALYQGLPNNDSDALLFIRTEDGALGDDGQYDGTVGWCFEDEWLRIVAVVDNTQQTMTKYVFYADDSMVGPVEQSGDGIDSKRSLVTENSAWGEDVFFLFADENFETHRGLISSLQIRDYAMSSDAVMALGGPRTTGVPQTVLGDLDLDGDVDIDDALAFMLCLSGPGNSFGECSASDVDYDKDADLADVAAYQLLYEE